MSPQEQQTRPVGRWVVLGGGVALIVGAFLPWATVTAFLASVSANGIDGDGKITATFGVVAAILGLASSKTAVTSLIVGLVAGGVSVYDFQNANRAVANATTDTVRASVGSGLYLSVAGGAAVVVGALMMFNERRATRNE